jgi:hypothetical protein
MKWAAVSGVCRDWEGRHVAVPDIWVANMATLPNYFVPSRLGD